MPWSVFELYVALPAFLLVLFRVSGLVLTMPLFGSTALPSQVKVALAAAISLAVFPMTLSHVPISLTTGSVVVGLAGELMLGIFIGLGVTIVFQGVTVAAQLIGQQSGMRLGAVFDPMSDTSTSLASQLYYLVAMMVFLSAGGDHAVVRSLLDSFATIPPLGFEVTPSLAAMLVDILALSFTMAVRVAGPTALALLLAFLVLGFVSRTVPQLNILTIGFPMKLMVALIIMALTMISLEPVLIEGLAVCMDGIRAGLGLDVVG